MNDSAGTLVMILPGHLFCLNDSFRQKRTFSKQRTRGREGALYVALVPYSILVLHVPVPVASVETGVHRICGIWRLF
jgi:hypothetical protein